MQLAGRDVDKVDEELLLSLVKDGTTEDRHLDFKEKLDISTPALKKEFLADVTSFANAAGGVLIFGVKERDKIAVELSGVELEEPDTAEAQLNSIIISGTDPRVPGFRVRVVALSSGRHAIVIGIPQSWMAPHMIAFQSKQNTRFYSRTSNGKYALDVTELRNAFLLTESKAEHIRRFRDERLSRIVAGEGSARLSGPVKSILHVVPLSAGDPTSGVDMNDIRDGAGGRSLRSLPWRSFCPSFEGFLFLGGTSPTGAERYIQVFRNGAIEAVRSDESRPSGHKPDMQIVPMGIFEGYSRDALFAAIETYHQLGVEPPVFVMYALCGVKGMIVGHPQRFALEDDVLLPASRDMLVVQERLIQSFDANLDELLHAMFDEVWNASGQPGSPRWDSDHKWLGG
jgi:hypothetical protein